MGVVYAAYDSQLGRPIAIKTIKGSIHDPAARDRLWREPGSAASVSHPAARQLYEIGEDCGEVFVAVALLEAPSMAGPPACRH